MGNGSDYDPSNTTGLFAGGAAADDAKLEQNKQNSHPDQPPARKFRNHADFLYLIMESEDFKSGREKQRNGAEEKSKWGYTRKGIPTIEVINANVPVPGLGEIKNGSLAKVSGDLSKTLYDLEAADRIPDIFESTNEVEKHLKIGALKLLELPELDKSLLDEMDKLRDSLIESFRNEAAKAITSVSMNPEQKADRLAKDAESSRFGYRRLKRRHERLLFIIANTQEGLSVPIKLSHDVKNCRREDFEHHLETNRSIYTARNGISDVGKDNLFFESAVIVKAIHGGVLISPEDYKKLEILGNNTLISRIRKDNDIILPANIPQKDDLGKLSKKYGEFDPLVEKLNSASKITKDDLATLESREATYHALMFWRSAKHITRVHGPLYYLNTKPSEPANSSEKLVLSANIPDSVPLYSQERGEPLKLVGMLPRPNFHESFPTFFGSLFREPRVLFKRMWMQAENVSQEWQENFKLDYKRFSEAIGSHNTLLTDGKLESLFDAAKSGNTSRIHGINPSEFTRERYGQLMIEPPVIEQNILVEGLRTVRDQWYIGVFIGNNGFPKRWLITTSAALLLGSVGLAAGFASGGLVMAGVAALAAGTVGSVAGNFGYSVFEKITGKTPTEGNGLFKGIGSKSIVYGLSALVGLGLGLGVASAAGITALGVAGIASAATGVAVGMGTMYAFRSPGCVNKLIGLVGAASIGLTGWGLKTGVIKEAAVILKDASPAMTQKVERPSPLIEKLTNAGIDIETERASPLIEKLKKSGINSEAEKPSPLIEKLKKSGVDIEIEKPSPLIEKFKKDTEKPKDGASNTTPDNKERTSFASNVKRADYASMRETNRVSNLDDLKSSIGTGTNKQV